MGDSIREEQMKVLHDALNKIKFQCSNGTIFWEIANSAIEKYKKLEGELK